PSSAEDDELPFSDRLRGVLTELPGFDQVTTDEGAAAHFAVHRTPDAPIIPGFEVVEVAGQGGMAVVYRARQARLGRTVALKTSRAIWDTKDLGPRLRIEAQVLSRLSHPNIVQLFDFGEFDGQPYLIEEYLDGGTLAARAKAGPIPEREA